MSICPFLPNASFELAYELLVPYLTTADAVCVTACSKGCARHVLHVVVRVDRDGRVFSRQVAWPLRLNIWLRTGSLQGADRAVRKQLMWCMNGARLLRTRMCRGCGCTTQRTVEGVALCEKCTCNRRLACYMQTRPLCEIVLGSILNVADYRQLNRPLSLVKWVTNRHGTQAFVSEVCRVSGVSHQKFLSAEKVLYSL